MSGLLGIDVSTYQVDIDMGLVKMAQVNFMYAKATEGVKYIDDKFYQNHDRAKAVGLPFGAYHFMRFDVPAIDQAHHFLSTVDGYSGQLIPMLDVEETDGTNGAAILDAIQEFSQIVKFVIGCNPILYTYYSFWQDYMGGSNALDRDYKLWIAEYNDDPQPTLPVGWSHYEIWQFSDHGAIKGIEGAVDLDRLNGNDLKVISLPA